MIDLEAKLSAASEIIDGRVIKDSQRVAVCVKGLVLGFPATIEAISPGWPFGVMYTVETNVVVDPSQPQRQDLLQLTIYPRMGRGLWSLFTKLLLFESKGMTVHDRKLEGVFNFSYDNSHAAERFVKYPGVSENLMLLETTTKFSEIVIKSDRGIYLSQPTSFNALNLDVCRATFRALGELGQVLFEAF